MTFSLARMFSRDNPGVEVATDEAGWPENRRAQDVLIAAMAREIGNQGREAAMLAGIIDDTIKASQQQTTALDALAQSSQHMAIANRTIVTESEQTQHAAQAARAAVERVGQGVRAATSSLDEVFDAATQITKIALQTRLVAFNASVEAKRAGDAGKGFAVVADAVKDLSRQVEDSSKQIITTINQLSERIEQLSRDLTDAQGANHRGGGQADTFHQAFKNVETKIATIAEKAAANLGVCDTVVDKTDDLKRQIDNANRELGAAKQTTDQFLSTSERLLELTADTGATTADTRYIEVVLQGAAELSGLLEGALQSGRISEADLFDHRYQPIAGTDPQQYQTRFVELTDRLFPPVQERIAAMDKVVFSAAVDRNGFLPTHNQKFSKAQGSDPVWNNANCRNRRLFNDKTGLSAGKNTRKFLLQTYRRDMGGGKFLLMKDLSAPIMVRGKHWGGLRIAYQF